MTHQLVSKTFLCSGAAHSWYSLKPSRLLTQGSVSLTRHRPAAISYRTACHSMMQQQQQSSVRHEDLLTALRSIVPELNRK